MGLSPAFLAALRVRENTFSHTWPYELVSALPDLLTTLLEKGQFQSLERLQLVDLMIEFTRDTKSKTFIPQWQKKHLIHREDNKNLLILSGELIISDRILKLSITYFLRGQRKFFKTQAQQISFEHEVEHTPFQQKDIQAFFAELKQENSILVDQKLAQLNGRPLSPVPSHMLIAFLLVQSMVVMNKESNQFTFTFHHAMWPGQALKLCYGQSNESFYSALYVDGINVLSLTSCL